MTPRAFPAAVANEPARNADAGEDGLPGVNDALVDGSIECVIQTNAPKNGGRSARNELR
jgi:hypothetical protein